MPIHNYARFIKFTQFCQISIPDSVSAQLEPIKYDDSSVLNYGLDQAQEMCQMEMDVDMVMVMHQLTYLVQQMFVHLMV